MSEAEAERDILTLELGDLKETLVSTKRNGRWGRSLQNNLKKVETRVRASLPPLSLLPPCHCCRCRCRCCRCMVVVVRRHRRRWWWHIVTRGGGGGCTVVHNYLWWGRGVSNKKVGEGGGTYRCRCRHASLPVVVLGLAMKKKSGGGGRTVTLLVITLLVIALPVTIIAVAVVVVVAALLLVAVEVVVVGDDDGGGGGGDDNDGGGGGGCGCWVVVVVVAGWLLLGRGALHAIWLPFWVCLGDAACHVIYVGTCCPNSPNLRWAGSSAVKRVLIVTVEVGGSNPQHNKWFFAPH
jgi:hypothetical protein